MLPGALFAQAPSGNGNVSNGETANAFRAGAYLELGPLLGNVTATNAKIWLKASASGKAIIAVGKHRDLSDRVNFAAPELTAETFFTALVLVSALDASTRYF